MLFNFTEFVDRSSRTTYSEKEQHDKSTGSFNEQYSCGDVVPEENYRISQRRADGEG